MEEKEQAVAFANSIWGVIDRYRAEFDILTASAVGILVLISIELSLQAHEQAKKDMKKRK